MAKSLPPTQTNVRSLAYDLWNNAPEPKNTSEHYWHTAQLQLAGPVLLAILAETKLHFRPGTPRTPISIYGCNDTPHFYGEMHDTRVGVILLWTHTGHPNAKCLKYDYEFDLNSEEEMNAMIQLFNS